MMTGRQVEIYKGLSSIGTEIAAFYHDGVVLSKMNLDTKPYLLGHLSREIESGLRDILTPKSLQNIEVCEGCSRPINRKIGHKKSIIRSLGLDDETEFVTQWYKVAKQFPKYAHRHGVWKDPRERKAFDDLWNQFEDILEHLVGNYYAIANRLDSILKMEEPSKEVLNALPNLLKEESRFLYFFNSLKSKKWLPFLEEEKYFDGSKNPEPVESEETPGLYSVPFWGILTYIEEISKQNLEAPQKETTETLIRITDSICQYRNVKNERVENYRTDYTVFKIICTLPEEFLVARHFDYIKNGLQSKWEGLIEHSFNKFIERLIVLDNKDLLLKGVELLLTHKIVKSTFEKVHSIFRSFELQRILEEFKDRLILVLGVDLLNLGLQKIKTIIDLDKTSFNNISIPAIEDHDQTSFPEKFDCQLVYLVRDTLEKIQLEDLSKKLKELLSEEHPILKRISIHIIRVRYKEFKNVFWSIEENPLSLTLTKHEVYELLKEHSMKFTNEEINQVIEWINTKEYYIPEGITGDKEKTEEYIAYRKREWLNSLLPSEVKVVTELIQELNTINNTTIEHPGFDSWHKSLTGHISPLTTEDISNLKIENFIDYYSDFKKEAHEFMGPSVEGLIDEFILTVRKNPHKYIAETKNFINSPSQIMYGWMRGLSEAWNDEKFIFSSEAVLKTVKRILEEDKFWTLHNDGDNFSRWFISNLLSFIQGGVRNDKHAFDIKLLPIIKEVLFIIYEQDKYPVFEHSDLPFTVLNNSKGKIYMAFIEYSLRSARISEKNVDRWDIDIKKLFTRLLKNNEEKLLFHFVLGQFLPNIHYLDEAWMINNFNKIFPLDSELNWAAAINGYFTFNRHPNRIRFNLLVEGSHIINALLNEIISGESKNGLIQQICSAYLHDFDSTDLHKEVIQALLNSKDQSIISNLIYFFWSPRFPFEKKVIHKIKPFWLEFFKKAIKLKDEELDTIILSGCCKWINRIEEIDEDIFHILSESVPYIKQGDRYSVIEALAKHIEISPERVGRILVLLFTKEVRYDISQEILQDMVEKFYKKRLKEIADKICLLHGENGFHFLREIYDKYNSKN